MTGGAMLPLMAFTISGWLYSEEGRKDLLNVGQYLIIGVLL